MRDILQGGLILLTTLLLTRECSANPLNNQHDVSENVSAFKPIRQIMAFPSGKQVAINILQLEFSLIGKRRKLVTD